MVRTNLVHLPLFLVEWASPWLWSTVFVLVYSVQLLNQTAWKVPCANFLISRRETRLIQERTCCKVWKLRTRGRPHQCGWEVPINDEIQKKLIQVSCCKRSKCVNEIELWTPDKAMIPDVLIEGDSPLLPLPSSWHQQESSTMIMWC